MHCKVVTFTAPAAPGNQTIPAWSNAGSWPSNATPQLVLLYGTGQTAAGTVVHGASFLGAFNATQQLSFSSFADGGTAVVTTNTGQITRTTNCLTILSDGGPTTIGAASPGATRFGTNQFSLNWTTASANTSGMVFIAVVFAGLDETWMGAIRMPTANGAQTTPVLGSGARWDCGLFIPTWHTTAVGSLADSGTVSLLNARTGIGWAARNGASIEQYACQYYDTDQQAAVEAALGNSSSHCMLVPVNNANFSTTTHLQQAALTAFNADGSLTFDWTLVNNWADKANLVILLRGVAARVGVVLQPTSTTAGTDTAVTGIGIAPKGVLLASSGQTVAASGTTGLPNNGTAQWAFGAGDGTTQAAITNINQDAALESEARRTLTTTKVISLQKYTAVDAATALTPVATSGEATIQSLDATGFTLDWIGQDGTQRRIGYLALGDAAAGAPAQTITPTAIASGEQLGRVLGPVAQKIGAVSYFYADWYNGGASPWHRLLNNRVKPTFVMINRNSGTPSGAPAEEPDWQHIVDDAQALGIKVYAYCRTAYADTNPSGVAPLATVKANIDTYYTDHPTINGIFLDEVTNTSGTTELDYYADLYSYIKGKGGDATVLLNPGTQVPEAYLARGDIILNFEGSAATYIASFPGNTAYVTSYPRDRFWHTVYEATTAQLRDDVIALSKTRHAGYVYVTDDAFTPNPWNDFPAATYWSDAAASITNAYATRLNHWVQLTGAGIASSERAGSPTIQPGAVGITVTGVGSAEAFGTPALANAAPTIVPSGIASDERGGTPTIQAGVVLLIPSGIASGEAAGTPVVVPAAVTVLVSGIASAEAFGAPTLVLIGVAVSPTGIASNEQAGAPVLLPGGVAVLPGGIASTEALGQVVVVPGGRTVTLSGIASDERAGTVVLVIGGRSVLLSGIASGEQAGTPVLVRGTVLVQPSGIASGEQAGVPLVLPGGRTLLPSGIASGEQTGLPTLASVIQVAPVGIGSNERLGMLVLVLGATPVQPVGIASDEAFGEFTVLGGYVVIIRLGLQARDRSTTLRVRDRTATLAERRIRLTLKDGPR